jgi:hypothetical protein
VIMARQRTSMIMKTFQSYSLRTLQDHERRGGRAVLGRRPNWFASWNWYRWAWRSGPKPLCRPAVHDLEEFSENTTEKSS